jgi:hypothetical protein
MNRGARGVVAQLLAHVEDVRVDGAGRDVGRVLPDAGEQLAAGQHLAAVLDEVAQELLLAVREALLAVLVADDVVVEVDLDLPEAVATRRRRCGAGPPGPAP